MKLSPVDISGPHITVWNVGQLPPSNSDIILAVRRRGSGWIAVAPPPIFRVIIILEVMVWMALMAPTPMYLENRLGWR